MNIVRRQPVPTGDILVVNGEYGLLECLGIGDYGKDHNIKADFLGLDRPLSKVDHTELLPLTQKWVVTISSQYGCPVQCRFCDVPRKTYTTHLRGNINSQFKFPYVNATVADLLSQISTCISLHPEITHTDRLNIHFARMGEPTYNFNIITAMQVLLNSDYIAQLAIDKSLIHPVISTMMPNDHRYIGAFLQMWCDMKNNLCEGNAGLQLSINSTDAEERWRMFNGQALGLQTISWLMAGNIPKGRKYTLNFAVADYQIDPYVLLPLFSPEHYIIKLTPMHKTRSATRNGIATDGDYTTFYPYERHEEALRKAGYDVLVFLASKEEDESRITCGNAILTLSR